MDEVLEKVAELSALHVASQRSYDVKFRKLEEDVAQAQEDATDRAIKRAKRERPPEFKFKGHQEQFVHNEEAADHVDSATKKLQKLAPTGDKEKKVLEDAFEELQQDTLVISDQQKCIRISYQSAYHWRTVDASKKALLAGSEEETIIFK